MVLCVGIIYKKFLTRNGNSNDDCQDDDQRDADADDNKYLFLHGKRINE